MHRTTSKVSLIECKDKCLDNDMISFLTGWCAAVLFNGFGAGRGWEAVVRAGDDHEEAVERLRGSGLLPEVLGTPAKRLIQKKIWIKILIQIKIHNQIQIQVAGVPAERQRPVLPQCPRQNLRPQLQTHSTGKISKFVLGNAWNNLRIFPKMQLLYKMFNWKTSPYDELQNF